MTPVKLPFYARAALILLAIALTLLFMYLGRTIFIPLFFAFLVSMLLYPLVKWFERLRLPRGVAALLSLLIFIIVIGGLIYFFSHQVIRFTKDLPNLEQKFSNKLDMVQGWVADKYHIDDSVQVNYINKSTSGLVNSAAGSLATTFVGIVQFIVLLFFFFFFTFFMLFYRKMLMQFVLSLFRNNDCERVKSIIIEVRNVIKSYVIGLLTEMAILIILIFTTLTIMGIKYALLMSVMTALLNIIPYLGIYTGLGLSMLITLTNGTGTQAIWVGVVFIVAHFIDANIILPRIVGGRVKLNPFITIVVVLIGHLVWGIPGMFLFIPLTAIIRIISEEIDELKPWGILIGEEKKMVKTKSLAKVQRRRNKVQD